MYIESVPNRNSPPAILLRESYRENGKVRKRTLCNLSDWPGAHIEGLRGVLKGGTVIAPDRDAFTVTRSLPHGHAALILGAARKIGLDGMIGPAGERCRDLVLAMIAARIIDPGSKLAAARALSPETATSSLGTILGLGEVDEDELYTALDWLRERQPAIETALANRHLKNGTLVLYDVSSSYMEGSHCPLAHRGYSRDGRKGTLQIVYGLLCAPDGCPVAIEVFDGNTGDPTTLAAQVRKLKQRAHLLVRWRRAPARRGLDHVVLVGDRGMITQARLTEDIKTAGLDWITALRAPAIKELVKGGALQLSLFDERDMASITSPDFPGERLIVCRNPDLAAERTRKRQDLLAATERDLARIQAATVRKRNPLHGASAIGLAIGAVIEKHKMRKHFEIEITDTTFSFAPKTGAIDAEAANDGIYMKCAPAWPPRFSTTRPPCEAINPCPRWNAPSAASRRSTFTSVRCITGWPIGSARTFFCACWPIISNGTCDGNWRHCCSTIPTRRRRRRYETVSWPAHDDPPRRPASRTPASPWMGCRYTAFGHCSPTSRHWRATQSSPRSRRAIR